LLLLHLVDACIYQTINNLHAFYIGHDMMRILTASRQERIMHPTCMWWAFCAQRHGIEVGMMISSSSTRCCCCCLQVASVMDSIPSHLALAAHYDVSMARWCVICVWATAVSCTSSPCCQPATNVLQGCMHSTRECYCCILLCQRFGVLLQPAPACMQLITMLSALVRSYMICAQCPTVTQQCA
jgi:hypothetical protein